MISQRVVQERFFFSATRPCDLKCIRSLQTSARLVYLGHVRSWVLLFRRYDVVIYFTTCADYIISHCIAIMHIRGVAEKAAEPFEMFDFAAYRPTVSIGVGSLLVFITVEETWSSFIRADITLYFDQIFVKAPKKNMYSKIKHW